MLYIPFRVKRLKIDKSENKIILSVYLFKNKENDININDNIEDNNLENEEKAENINNVESKNIYNFGDCHNENVNKYREYIFSINDVKLMVLGYIKEIEELKSGQLGVVKLFKKAITLGVYNDKNEKMLNIREQVFVDIILRENEKNSFFRIDLSYFDYKDFLKDELTFSSLINMRKFFSKLTEVFNKDLFDNNFLNFLEMNSLQKIQRYNSVFEFQDYVISKAKEKGIL
jgi:hypothetical protein